MFAVGASGGSLVIFFLMSISFRSHPLWETALYRLKNCLRGSLTNCILGDSSTVICWTSLFVIFGVTALFCCFYSIFDGKSCDQTM